MCKAFFKEEKEEEESALKSCKFSKTCRLQPDVLKLALEFNTNELFIGGTQEKLRRRGLRQFWTN